MKIAELIHRIGRRAKGGDYTKLGLAEQMDIVHAANVGLAKVYNRLPVYFKQMTAGFVLPAPVTVSVQVTNGSTALGNSPFTAAQIGQTVIINGDPGWNTVVDVNALLNPYNGTTGTQSGTLYGDACYSTRYPFDRIVGNPRFSDPSQFGIIRRDAVNGMVPLYGLTPTVGRPRYWWVQPFGNSQGNTPLLFIKFFPFPDVAYGIDVDLAFWAKRITLADVQSNVALPVPDQFLDACLVPLGIRALMSTPSFETRNDEKLLLEAAEDAEEFLSLQPGQVGAPSNRVQTPFGY